MKVNLNDILQSQDDGDAYTPDTTDTLIAIKVDELTLTGTRLWDLDDVQIEDLDSTEEQAYLEMVGLSHRTDIDLYSYTFTKSNGSEATIVTELELSDMYDNAGDTLAHVVA